MSKQLIDDLHAYHKRGRHPDFEISDYTRAIESIHFYDSMVVIEKALVDAPELVYSGKARF
jgi:hypothetical protein